MIYFGKEGLFNSMDNLNLTLEIEDLTKEKHEAFDLAIVICAAIDLC